MRFFQDLDSDTASLRRLPLLDIPVRGIEYDTYLVDGEAGSGILLGITLSDQLSQRIFLTGLVDAANLELEKPDVPGCFDRQVQTALIRGVFGYAIPAKAGQESVEHAGIITLVAADGIVGVPLVGDGSEKGMDSQAQGLGIPVFQRFGQFALAC